MGPLLGLGSEGDLGVVTCHLRVLPARSVDGCWRGRRAAVIAIVGLASFWFNFIGINLLVSGLHSYAGV